MSMAAVYALAPTAASIKEVLSIRETKRMGAQWNPPLAAGP
jgi:hypothetical protein